MCTVVYIPQKNTLFFASLRDENPNRPMALAPHIQTRNAATILSPIDAQSGGTWIGVTESQHVIILLNGGFMNHEKKTNYRKSRGLIVLELLQTENPIKEWDHINLLEIEPFTLVVWGDNKLFQLIWDGEKKYISELDNSVAYVWSSATLYDRNIKELRASMFQEWIKKNHAISSAAILEFFYSYSDKENGFIMSRHQHLKTLSYTCIEIKKPYSAVMKYHDLLNHIRQTTSLDFIQHSHL